MQCIKKAYLDEIKKMRASGSNEVLESLPWKKQGRPLLLGDKIDGMVQSYIRRVCEEGVGVSIQIVLGAARGILKTIDKQKLREFGGHIDLSRQWALSLLCRMNFVQRKATTAKSKLADVNFKEKRKEFLDDLVSIVELEEIPPELVLNWDQTGIKLVPSASWTMHERGSRRVELVGISDKRQITAVFCGSLMGAFLPIQLIYKGKTDRCHPHFNFPLDWDITHSPKHWSTEETMIRYVNNIIVPFVEKTRESLGEDKAAVIIMDNFKGQVTPAMNELLEQHNIHSCLLPPNTTDRLQPMDLSVNKPAKAFLRGEFQKWYSDKIMQQLDNPTADFSTAELNPVDLSMAAMKEITGQWLVKMYDYISNNPDFTVNGFLHSGISKALDGITDDDLPQSDTNDNANETSSDSSDESGDDNAVIDYIVL